MTIESIASGVISGLIASLVLFIFLLMIKPRIKVSGKLCLASDGVTYRVKVINCSRVNLIDVKYTLHICKPLGGGIIDVEEILPAKRPIESIRAKRSASADPEASYAMCISYDLGSHSLSPGAYYLFTICARHSWSGAVSLREQRYDQSQIERGQFETRDSMNIVPIA